MENSYSGLFDRGLLHSLKIWFDEFFLKYLTCLKCHSPPCFKKITRISLYTTTPNSEYWFWSLSQYNHFENRYIWAILKNSAFCLPFILLYQGVFDFKSIIFWWKQYVNINTKLWMHSLKWSFSRGEEEGEENSEKVKVKSRQ